MPSGVYVDVTIAGADDVVAPVDPDDNGKALVRNSGTGKYEHAGVVSTDVANTFTDTQTFQGPDSTLSAEQLLNPTLTDLTDWLNDGGWSWNGSAALHNPGTADYLYQNLDFLGGPYVIIAVITGMTAGTVLFEVGTGIGPSVNITSDGTYTINVNADVGNGYVSFYGDDLFDGAIASASCKRIEQTPSVIMHKVVKLIDLPTAIEGLEVGTLWNDHGVPRIVDEPVNGEPFNLQVAANTYKNFTLTWENGSTNESGILVGASVDGSSWQDLEGLLVRGSGNTSLTVTSYPIDPAGRYQEFNLTPYHTYWRAIAYREDPFGIRTYSPDYAYSSGTIDFSGLAGPTGLAVASVDESTVSFTWDAWSSDLFDGQVRLYASDDGGATWGFAGSYPYGTTSADLFTTPGDYQYKLAFIDGGPESNIVSATTTEEAEAVLPTDFVADAVLATRIELSWTADPVNTSYEIAYAVGGAVDHQVTGASSVTGDNFADTSVDGNTEYAYAIRASHKHKRSSWVFGDPVTTPDYDTQTPANLPNSPVGLAPGKYYRTGNQVFIA